MKVLLLKSLLFLLFSISANAQILPVQNPDTTTSTTPTATSTTSTLTSTTSSTSTTASTTASHTSSSATTSTTSASTSTSANASTTSSPVISSPVVTSTDGTPLTTATVVTVVNPSSSASSSQPTPSAPPSSDSSSLSTGSIIGLSVAGGVAVIGLIAFFIWKLTRKRFSDFDDDEAIKWPNLNDTHGGGTYALPVNDTGRAGFDTSKTSLSRINSDNHSTADLPPADPYAVPPFPQFNPNQPYRDDPGAHYDAYNDPYKGPIPRQGTGQDWSEAIPMTHINPGGRMSPGPNVAGRISPGSQAHYGRASPGPQAAYGRMSPGPQAAYISPPAAGYDGYGAR